MIITAGSVNVSLPAYFVDDDGGTAPGEPTTGLLFSDIETGGSASYQRQGAARVDLTLITLASAAATHADGGFILIDDTNMPGTYRVDFPDAAFATGADFVIIQMVAAAAKNTLVRPLLIDLTDVDLRDAVSAGLSRLDAAITTRLAPTTAARTLDILATGEVPIDFDTSIGTLAAAQIEAGALNGKGDWNIGKTGYSLAATGLDAIVSTATGMVEIAKAIWDRVLSGATHNIVNSAGRRLRALEDATLIRGDAFQAGSTTTSLVLDAAASAVDDFFNHTIIRIIDGVAAGQERIIADYNGTTKAVTITPALTTAAPGVGDEFKIISGGSVHAETQGGGYEGGAVWIDTIDGVAGTLLYVNGTVDNPVNSIADARTLADALGMHVFHSLPGSTFTLAQAFNDFEFIGAGFTVALGGQDIGGSRFFNCAISGIGTGSVRVVFRDCLVIGATTLATASLLGCNFAADLTLSAAGIYRITEGIHGSATAPAIDFGAAVLNTTVHVHDWHGALTVKNMGQLGTDVLHFDSAGGKLTLDATNVGGTANLNGTFDFVDSSTGMTINKTGAILDVIGTPVGVDISADIAAVQADTDNMQTRLPAALVGSRMDGNMSAIAGVVASATLLERGAKALVTGAAVGTPTTTVIDTDLTETTTDHYKGRIVTFTTGNIAGQSSDITGYNGTTKELTVTALTDAPVATDEFVIS